MFSQVNSLLPERLMRNLRISTSTIHVVEHRYINLTAGKTWLKTPLFTEVLITGIHYLFQSRKYQGLLYFLKKVENVPTIIL